MESINYAVTPLQEPDHGRLLHRGTKAVAPTAPYLRTQVLVTFVAPSLSQQAVSDKYCQLQPALIFLSAVHIAHIV